MIEPRVSVIIPTYNHARYVGQAIESVLGQTYGDIEVIVVDDGSTDDTRMVVQRFGDRVRYVWQENRGLSGARNTGLREASGQVIALLDADDLYEPTFLCRIVMAFEANPNADAVYCGYRFVDASGNPLPQIERRVIPTQHLYRALLDGNFLVPACMVARKRCYDECGEFDESLRGCEDWDMWLRFAKRYQVLGIRDVLVRYRVLPGSMSSDPELNPKFRHVVLAKHLDEMPPTVTDTQLARRRARGRAHLTSVVEHLQRDDTERAYASLKDMVDSSPDLLTQIDVSYELAWGKQPKGFRGDFATLNLKSNAQTLLSLLDRLFRESPPQSRLRQHRHSAFAYANYAVALIAYGNDAVTAARSHMLAALRCRPNLIVEKQFRRTLLRALVGRQTVHWAREILRTPSRV
jgi:hypothetical protein